ncbi:hypothetical protein FOG48_04027 [Hanseniaspora uvarum]|nr:hypothetical protein FOG48_04027 [Hanseniaspora uvarum]
MKDQRIITIMSSDDNISKKRHTEELIDDSSVKKLKSVNIDHSVMSEPISQDIQAINMENILDDNTHYTKHVSKGYKQKNDLASQMPNAKTDQDILDSLETTPDDTVVKQVWSRKPLYAKDLNHEFLGDINFQQIDSQEFYHNNESAVRFYGVTDTGYSIMCSVTGFQHYLYIPSPYGNLNDQPAALKKELEVLVKYLNDNYLNGNSGVSEGDNVSEKVTKIEQCYKHNIWGYQGDATLPFLKVYVNNHGSIFKIRKQFEDGNINIPGRFVYGERMTTFDNIAYMLRLMIDLKIVGMSWLTLPKNKHKFVTKHNKISNCQIETLIDYKDLVVHSADDAEWSKFAPLRILSFDLECAGRPGVFPEPSVDPVIQIANVVNVQGSASNLPFVKNVFTVDTCSAISGIEVFSYKKEEEMLLGWKDFVKEVDPDIIIGYNIEGFDLPYLLDRAQSLKLDSFPYFGKLTNVKNNYKTSTFTSKALGTRDNKIINISGRLQLDILAFIRREYKLRSYTLNAVSAHFLNEQKEDVHYSIITDLHNGDADTRRRLAIYCLKDALLPLKLLEKLMPLINYTEMSRVTGVPFSYLLTRGQQIKVISQIFRKCLSIDTLVPNLTGKNGTDEQYEGATVIEPIRGFYNMPIATLDFNSLYPSIIMAHNLCYTTLLDKNTISRLKLVKDEDYIVTPNGDCFVMEHKKKGILPEILDELIKARSKAKKQLKSETDPFRKKVLDGKQLALKISANSVYGFTGATIGKLPCLQISSSVTAFGREMILKTKKYVEDHYTIKNGFKHNAVVVYGDTDSVMIKFGTDDLKESMAMGDEAARAISQIFKNPINLEFEKCYFPYLLINKKRYAGLYWTNPNNYDKLDQKGLASVRRDSCPLVSLVMNKMLKNILIDRDVDKGLNYLDQIIKSVLQNNIDISKLIISKALAPNYTNPQPHAVLAKKIAKREGTGPQVGDRVDYVIVGGNTKLYDRAEDPLYVLENNIPIDSKYYLNQQLKNPIVSIIGPIIGENKAIAKFNITEITITTGKTGALMGFLKKVRTCQSCKNPLKKDDKGPLCDNCSQDTGKIYLDKLIEVREMQDRFNQLWTKCQRCSGSLHNEVLCSNKNCDIFYMRIKTKNSLQEKLETISQW